MNVKKHSNWRQEETEMAVGLLDTNVEAATVKVRKGMYTPACVCVRAHTHTHRERERNENEDDSIRA